MQPNSDSQVPFSHYFPPADDEDLSDPDDIEEPVGTRERDAERARLAVTKMLERARVRQDNWRRQLADERFEEFKPEMRRRIAVEQDLIDGLQAGRHPTSLLPKYLRDAVHRTTAPKSEDELEAEALRERIAKATTRRRDLDERLRLTPMKQERQRDELLRKIEVEVSYIHDLKAKLRQLGM